MNDEDHPLTSKVMNLGIISVACIACWVLWSSYRVHNKEALHRIETQAATRDEANANAEQILQELSEFKEEIRPADVLRKVTELEVKVDALSKEETKNATQTELEN